MMKILVICTVLLCATASSALNIAKLIGSLRQQTCQLEDPSVTLVQQCKIARAALTCMDKAMKCNYVPGHIKVWYNHMITLQARNETHEMCRVAYGGAAASPTPLMLILPLALMLLWRNL